tara:strand:- start:162 stop:905 length:744 start_codon:yes stop_codon:yes gene_type:complete
MKISKSLFLEILQDEANQVLTEEITVQQLEKIADKIIKKLDSIDMSMDLVYGALAGGKEATAVTRARQRAFGRAMTPQAAVNELFDLDERKEIEKRISDTLGKSKFYAKGSSTSTKIDPRQKIIPLTKGGGGLGQSLRGKLEKSLKGRPPADSAEFAKDVSAELAKLLQKNKILVQEKDIKVSELVSDWAREYNINRDEREVLVPLIKNWLVDQLKKKKYPKNIIAAIKESKQSIFEDVLEGIFYEV